MQRPVCQTMMWVTEFIDTKTTYLMSVGSLIDREDLSKLRLECYSIQQWPGKWLLIATQTNICPLLPGS